MCKSPMTRTKTMVVGGDGVLLMVRYKVQVVRQRT